MAAGTGALALKKPALTATGLVSHAASAALVLPMLTGPPAGGAESQGPLYAGTITQSSLGVAAWANLANMGADDGSNASSNLALGDSTSETARLTNFGFSAIPDSATIDGITVEIERFRTAADGLCRDLDVLLTKDGGNPVGDDKAATTSAWPTSPTIATYGGAADLWGTTWTPAEINASTFGVHFRVRDADGSDIANVDLIRITVHYTTVRGENTAVATNAATAALTLPAPVVTGTGNLVPVGTAALSLPLLAVAGTGLLSHEAAGALSLSLPVVAGTARDLITTAGALSLFLPTVAGAGTASQAGTGALSLFPPQIAGVGNLVPEAAGALSLFAPVLAASATATHAASAALTMPLLIVDGDGLVSHEASAALNLSLITLAGTGNAAIEATAALSFFMPALSGVGNLVPEATGALSLPMLVLHGYQARPLVLPSGLAGILLVPAAGVASGSAILPAGKGAASRPLAPGKASRDG